MVKTTSFSEAIVDNARDVIEQRHRRSRKVDATKLETGSVVTIDGTDYVFEGIAAGDFGNVAKLCDMQGNKFSHAIRCFEQSADVARKLDIQV